MRRRFVALAPVALAAWLGACDGEPVVGGRLDAGNDVSDIQTVDDLVDVKVAPDVTDAPDAPDVTSAPDAMDGMGGCRSNEMCAGDPGGPVCDTASGRCVRCVASNDTCPASQHCDPMTFVCVDGCRNDDGCAAPAPGDGGTQADVPVDSGDASVPARVCDTTAHRCVQCRADENCPMGMLCVGQTCVAGCSAARPCAGSATCCDGACVDTQTNTEACGTCTTRCTVTNGSPACVAGRCSVASCTAPFADCNNDPADGCETNTAQSATHCGMCGRACMFANATGACTAGACTITACATNFLDCDTSPANGCEVDARTDAMNCGMCGRACRARGACIAGVCIEQRSCRTPGTPGCGVVDIAGGGPFTLGGDSMANDASTAQPGVSVGRFALDRYEVTVARFRRYWEAGHPGVTGGVLYPGETAAGVTVPWSGPMSVTGPSVRDTSTASPNFCNWTVSASDREGHPINCVDWYTAQAFCVWDGGLLSTNGQTGRLPTEAEWEFAARGTEGRPWPWGTTMIASQACWDRCRNYPTDCLGTCLEEDASFAAGATPSGVRHMVGNVWEWTADNYGSYSAMTSSDPCINRSGRQNPVCNSSATGNRVVRGGSWLNIDVADLRSASRLYGTPVGRYYYLGFRCAGTVTE